MDQVYLDKLDGKIAEGYWQRKTAEWQQEEQQVQMALAGIEQAGPDRLLSANRILELANKGLFSVCCAESTPAGRIAQNRTIELLD